MRRLKEIAIHRFREKASVFLTELHPARNAAERATVLGALRKRDFDATHHCSAWREGVPVSAFGADDDGEPSGTAGRPMLAVLEGAEVTDLIAVCIRWFGGTKLGTGGLVRAYTEGVQGALAEADGTLLTERRWVAGYRHGEELLPRIDEMLAATAVSLAELGGIVVGTGPGAFTGLRVGLATAKALARGLDIPIAGVATSEALLAAASLAGAFEPQRAVLLLPAGPSDRVVVSGGAARLIRGGEEAELELGTIVVAVDLPGRALEEALALGAEAEAGLAAALVRLGARRLAAGGDDVARLVPEYVTLPRGVSVAKGEVRWSHDHR